MAARFAVTTFSVTLPSGAAHLVILGALRDSTHPAVTAAPGLFSAAPVAVHPRLMAYEAAYPAGPEL